MTRVDIIDESFVVADPAEAAAHLCSETRWSRWFPGLHLRCYEDRGAAGKKWTVDGTWKGTAEVWVEAFGDGAIVHVYLRADDPPHRWWARTSPVLRGRMFSAKDALEGQRAPGVARTPLSERVVSDPPAGDGSRRTTKDGTLAEQTSSSIVIDAPPKAVMAVIADFESYPGWARGVKSAEVLTESDDGRAGEVRFELDAAPIKDTYTLSYDWTADEQVTWTLVEAKMLKAMAGAYILTAKGDRTDVTYELAVDLSIPMIGLLKRKAEKVIIDSALKGLKKRVESAG